MAMAMAMAMAMRSWASLLILCTLLPSFILAQGEAPAASTFYLAKTQTQFSLNIANETNSADIHIFFTSPAYSWVGVGFGAQMKNSLMFIMYPSASGNNVTVSPRLATGHSEPAYDSKIQLDILSGTGVQDDMFILKAVCRYCRAWTGGSLDTSSTAYPMIYAFGPGSNLQSNSPSAPLKRHVRYGKFTMDMLAATGAGGVPTASNATSGVQMEGGLVKDHDRMNLAHAVLGCLAIFVAWPLNMLVVAFVKRIGIHHGVSAFILVLLILSFALGIATSGEYIRSKSFNSPHQIFGFLSILPILLTSVLPIPPLTRLLPNLIRKTHTPLTLITLLFLIVTGGLGLRLASQTTPIILSYTAVSLFVTALVVIVGAIIRRRGSAYARATGQRRVQEEDEQDLVLAAYYAGRKMEEDSRSTSAASLERPGMHGRSGSGGNSGNVFGGGTMPGPQYLLNMHPGVPVQPAAINRW